MPIYLFLDEAGNFDFSPSGTRWLMVCAVALGQDDRRVAAVSRLRFEVNQSGVDLTHFHASSNTRWVRGRFTELIRQLGGISGIYVSVLDKTTLADGAPPDGIYQELLIDALVLAEAQDPAVMVYVDTIPIQRHRRIIHQAMSKAMGRRPIRFHPSCSMPELQVADYVCWAVWRKLTRNDSEPLARLGMPNVIYSFLTFKS